MCVCDFGLVGPTADAVALGAILCISRCCGTDCVRSTGMMLRHCDID